MQVPLKIQLENSTKKFDIVQQLLQQKLPRDATGASPLLQRFNSVWQVPQGRVIMSITDQFSLH